MTSHTNAHAQSSASADSVVLGIVHAVADADGADPTALPPLGEAVDTDALTTVLDSAGRRCRITFRYFDYVVTVRGDGAVTVDSQ
ncbi:hypothetical protein SAMN06269185_0361 [Natronoarchaeum philippinense]|uniref:Halobacterial output domain-containing protein n=1 Tax=Natronoarchaeum philippinense TaxID=558529 RepID=A0A285N496_NATPI|nr:HalOD1 output domain-containing protein [Natronoarchaeum philippinense]SNZ03753.1 hypothetical protein SAMN06269185_0361 [Natronoarchaeum philippinense]